MLCTIFYSLVELYQKTHSFAAFTCSFLILLNSWINIYKIKKKLHHGKCFV